MSLLCVQSCVTTSHAKKKHTTSQQQMHYYFWTREREREALLSFVFFLFFVLFFFFGRERERVHRETTHPTAQIHFHRTRRQGKIRREKKLPLWTVFLHIYRTACLSTHTHSNLFKRYGYVFVSGEENTVGRVLTVALARFDSRRARSKRRFCASLLFFLFPSAAKVIFLPPPLVAGGNAARF